MEEQLPQGTLSSVGKKRLLKELQDWLVGEPVPGMSVERPERLDLYCFGGFHWRSFSNVYMLCLGGMSK